MLPSNILRGHFLLSGRSFLGELPIEKCFLHWDVFYRSNNSVGSQEDSPYYANGGPNPLLYYVGRPTESGDRSGDCSKPNNSKYCFHGTDGSTGKAAS